MQDVKSHKDVFGSWPTIFIVVMLYFAYTIGYLLWLYLVFGNINKIQGKLFMAISHKIILKCSVMGCGSSPNHRHHYLKRLSAATILENTMTLNIIYPTTLQQSTLTQTLVHYIRKKMSTPVNSS
jgi:phosphoglycerol transferase MdoB-like AlkP superfamily enzyme